MRTSFARNAAEEGEPLRGNLRIRDDVFDRREFRFRQEECLGIPVQEGFIEQLLRAHRGANDPEGAAYFARERGDEKRLGCFGHMGKSDRRLPGSKRPELRRDGLGGGDPREQFRATRFLHAQWFVGFARSSIGRATLPLPNRNRRQSVAAPTNPARSRSPPRGAWGRVCSRFRERGLARHRSWRRPASCGPRA